MKYEGIVLYGTSKVGRFHHFEEKDSSFFRKIEMLWLNSNCWDLTQNISIPLRLMYVEILNEKENTFRLIEELGQGTINSNYVWVNDNEVILRKAILITHKEKELN